MDRVKSRTGNFGLRIADCGLKQSNPKSEIRNPKSRRPRRRGVLLLVVLSMLVLFMLIGTAFLMTSGQSRDAAKAMAKKGSHGNLATKDQERALMQLLRDTENPASAAYSHSLLRDFYGTDGFQGLIYAPRTNDLPAQAGYLTRYSSAVPANVLGPTQGQFIDIYVRALGFSANDPQTTVNEATPPLTTPDMRHVLKLDRNVANQPQVYSLPLTKGYFNGCLLTVTSGPAAGQSTRILDYEYLPPELSTATPTATATHMFRIRVMAFGRTDGQSLTINTATSALTDLAGASFIVNGRPFNGTGVGFNPLAQTGQARLTALEVFPLNGASEGVGAELALLPNARYFNPLQILVGTYPFPGSPFAPTIPLANFSKLNDPLAATPFFNYPTYNGPGDADEGYDAADFQNMWLALQTVTPRAQGRVVHDNSGTSVYLDANDPAVLTNAAQFLRLDLEDVPLPSFHRPDLVNFWYHRLHALLVAGGMDADDAVQAILQPYDAYGNVNPNVGSFTAEQAALIAGIKRKIMMRPTREDHPNFDGGNTQSQPATLPGSNLAKVIPGTSPPQYNIAIPYWEAIGPWDVDNDNDGVADSVWLDLGDPVQELEDGTRVKALYAPLIIDLDGRLNTNAHGLVDHIVPANLAYAEDASGNPMGANLAGRVSSDVLPQGLGMGPPEISLRPLFPIPWGDAAGTLDYNVNRSENLTKTAGVPIDDYATILIGREMQDGTAVSGRAGYGPSAMPAGQAVTPGTNYQYLYNASMPTAEVAVPELAAQIKFFQYPWTIYQRSAHGTPPDLFGRYAIGLDYSGQPNYEVLYDSHSVAPAALQPNIQVNPRPLLTDSPYEINLSDSQRRGTLEASFANATVAFNNTIDSSFAGGAKGLNDDAPYSLTDLERVLRAWDADSGMLPSRLWDVVDAFDPLKLMEFDTFRTLSMANDAFDPTSRNVQIKSAEHLAAAQQIASINRHLVTTDSYGPPVPSITPPAYMLTVPDAVLAAYKAAYFVAINRKPPNSMAEMLELRIRRAYAGAGWPATPFDDYDPNGDHDLDGMLNGAPDPEYVTAAAQAARLNRAALINTYIQQLLAPELLAGKRLDLNRPFGDGQDNPNLAGITNGVVDDPMEAGDPFLDINGNGKWDDDPIVPDGEPFINLDGSLDNADKATYTPPRDQLWADLTASGVMAEPIAFDYTNGFGYPLFSDASEARVRNLESQGRQVYARHLFCLMMMLVDENYIAPWDANDPQIRQMLNTSNANSQVSVIKAALQALPSPPPAATIDQEARQIVLRKLTIRAIAQWAVNCVDMRDADAIMTPFEYDENPWDGWGCMGDTQKLIPLDGDPATDENVADIIDWKEVVANNGAKTIAKMGDPTGINQADAPTPLNQTRGLVWGAERPELLITESIGLHDRRTEDLGADFTQKTLAQTSPDDDNDLDQRLRPKGSVFIELYNPWSPTGQYPAEIYSLFNTKDGSLITDNDGDGEIDDRNGDGLHNAEDMFSGVELGRLSTFGAKEITPATTPEKNKRYQLTTGVGNGIARSPVWRMIVVEENQEYRNDDTYDDTVNSLEIDQKLRTGVHSGSPGAHYSLTNPANGYFEAADPDRIASFFDQGWPATGDLPSNEPYVERAIYFTSDNSKRLDRQDADDPSGTNENYLSLNPKNVTDKLRLPAQFSNATGSPRSARYFIAPDANKAPASGAGATTIGDVAIAPIKPGRYAVIGTAGVQYDDEDGVPDQKRMGTVEDSKGNQITKVPRYVTPISRIDLGGGTGHQETPDDQHLGVLDITRRIEMLPNPNPESQQILVASNGGTPLFPRAPGLPTVARRDNEVVYRTNGTPRFKNIYVGKGNPATPTVPLVPDTQLIPPCVAIPIKDMSISEPLDLYVERRRVLDDEEQQRSAADMSGVLQTQSHYYNPEAANGEGSFVNAPDAFASSVTAYDDPFDLAPELRRNGTTRNYRTIHLQRLADPTLPWNPLPTLPDGTANPQHDAKLPVNVYRTIDSSSVDLTAYNGTSSREHDEPDVASEGRYLPRDPVEFRNMFQAGGPHQIHLKSLERGAHADDKIAADATVKIAARALWRQEPINMLADMQTWLWIDPNQITPTPEEARFAELAKRAKETRLRDREILEADITSIGNVEDADFQNFPDSLKPERPAHFDFVLDHTLGFSNESFGAMVSKTDLGAPNNLPLTANGTPSKDGNLSTDTLKFPFTRHDPELEAPVASTYPWLAWGNRPFVSADELLNVPGTSSSQMLRQYSTIFRTAFNPYDGTGFDLTTGDPLTMGQRLATYLSPYGHLFSAFQTASAPAGVFRHPTTGAPIPDSNGNWQFVGAPHYYRILEYVQVPSRFVGTDTMLTAEIFNDVPGPPNNDPIGTDILGPQDPRANFRPPFNKVSRERDPGEVNLNTVTGRRDLVNTTTNQLDRTNGVMRHWSEVFDGIMHRDKDNNHPGQISHLGPSWRDVVMSRRGYAQNDANNDLVDKLPSTGIPDTFSSGLNKDFPSFFSNPFRSSDAGDLVPLQHMIHFGIDASWQRRHHYNRGGRGTWGSSGVDDNANGITDESREAGYGGDDLVIDRNATNGALLPTQATFPAATDQSGIPLFSESFTAPAIDGERNPAFYYQPMTRMENLVTNRSNVFAIWITVGYFEVEPAPNWNDPDNIKRDAVRARFGGTPTDTDPATIAGLALYNRVYPDGYMLGREVGSETGDVKRPRGFFIVDRTEEVGFKPGEDLNVEKMIKLRRRIE